MDLKSFAFLVSDVSDMSELVPALIFLRFLSRNSTYKAIGWYFVLSWVLRLFTLITAEMVIRNMFAFHLLALVEVTFLYAFYSKIIFDEKPRWSVIVILTALTVIDSIYIEGLDNFNSIGWTFSVFFLLCLGLRYLYKLYQDLENIQLETNPLFLINTGLLIYFSGSLFTYIFGSAILSQEAKGFFHNAWVIQCFSNIVKNIIVSYGLWQARFR